MGGRGRKVLALGGACASLLSVASASSAPSELPQAAKALADGDYVGAISRLTPLADAGDPLATRLLGGLYLAGKGAPQDCARAVDLLLRSAKSGDARAPYLLGKSYGTGTCVEKNPRLALDWYRKAADRNDPDAAFSVGLYLSGEEGVPANLGEAYYWYIVSVQQFKMLIGAANIPRGDPSLRNMRAAETDISVLDGRMTSADKARAENLISQGSQLSFNLRCDGSEITSGRLVRQGSGAPPSAHFSRVFRIDPRVGFYCSEGCELMMPLQRIDSATVIFRDRPVGPPELGRSYERVDLRSGSYSKREKTALIEVDATGQCAREEFGGFPRRSGPAGQRLAR
jgi:hypothetical protein